MDEHGFVHWLKEEQLFSAVESYVPSFTRLFTGCLQAKREQVLIITDLGQSGRRCSAIAAGCYLLAAKRLKLDHSIVLEQPVSATASSDVVHALLGVPDSSIVVLCLSGKIGGLGKIGKSFRRFAAEHHLRFLSTSGLIDLETKYASSFMSSIDVDYADLKRRGAELKRLLDYGDALDITTAAGTNLHVNIKGMKAISNDGDYAAKGGNMPAGEVYIPPRGKGVEGTIVIDGTMRHTDGTILIKDPVTLKVEKGEIVSIHGREEAKLLERTLRAAEESTKKPWGIRRIGEIGIGINKNATMIPLTVVSEKALGTAHVGIGSNYWFGGTVFAKSHLDQVFKEPRVYVDGKKIDAFSP